MFRSIFSRALFRIDQSSCTLPRIALLVTCLLVSTLTTTSCSTEQEEEKTSTENASAIRWPQMPISVYAGEQASADADKRNDLKSAIAFWNEKAGRQVLVYQGTWTGKIPKVDDDNPQPSAINGIFYLSPWQYGSSTAGRTVTVSENSKIESAVIYVNPHREFCFNDCSQSKATSYRRLLAHELGHLIGLEHHSDSQNIMFSVLRKNNDLTDATVDKQALDALTQ